MTLTKKFSRWELEGKMSDIPCPDCGSTHPVLHEHSCKRVQIGYEPRFGDGVDINPFVPPKHRPSDSIAEEMRKLIHEDKAIPTTETYREQIAHLIRLLTYRELCQIGAELVKVEPGIEAGTSDMAKVLDDWAYMVKEETNV